jgi:hypothetical protein
MTKTKKPSVTIDFAEKSFGIYFNIVNLDKIKKYQKKHLGKTNVDVLFKLDDVAKEYTFDDFFKRLGFRLAGEPK